MIAVITVPCGRFLFYGVAAYHTLIGCVAQTLGERLYSNAMRTIINREAKTQTATGNCYISARCTS